ncbi:UPF0462 protein C4orf33 homolog isoform X2 [Antedon mediterranea]|uniref:UPF0462 protein C4orf33 homolog isoform X2 n=1 Tax=Antedon mediterranea TaxID=105859 RepID=UPI003AF7CB9E
MSTGFPRRNIISLGDRIMNELTFEITQSWDGASISHVPVQLRLATLTDTLQLSVKAPFFNDPAPPNMVPGEPQNQLWDYEVIEAFFLGEKKQYLEVEVSPHGCHLVLMLNGCRNMCKDKLPLKCASKLHSNNTWTCEAYIPFSYIPPGPSYKFNAFAIHGVDSARTYEALYPAEAGVYEGPDFHRLHLFQDLPKDFLQNKAVAADWLPLTST